MAHASNGFLLREHKPKIRCPFIKNCMATNNLDHKAQLVKCVIDLAARAEELNQKAIQGILLVVAGTIADGSEEDFSLICADYARLRILMLQMEKERDEESPF
jgi:hypothetical protein